MMPRPQFLLLLITLALRFGKACPAFAWSESGNHLIAYNAVRWEREIEGNE